MHMSARLTARMSCACGSYACALSSTSLFAAATGRPVSENPFAMTAPHSFAVFAVSSVVLSAAVTRLNAVAPADVCSVGPFARGSVRADNGAAYASPTAKLLLRRYGRRDGCHTCGHRTSAVIADHQPPNHLNTMIARPQYYLPQCADCSAVQSRAVRQRQRVLVMPRRIQPTDALFPLPLLTTPIQLAVDRLTAASQ